MTIGDYISNGFLIFGSFLVAVTVLYSMWFFIIYVFLGGDDQERAHAKKKLLYASITLIFLMIFWGLFAVVGRAMGL